MKQILFPTDFMATAVNAFAYGLALAQQLELGISTLHIYDKHLNLPISEQTKNELLEEDGKLLNIALYKQLVEAIHTTQIPDGYLDAAPAMQHLLHQGKAVQTIIDIADSLPAEFIVMGTRGEASDSNKVFGSLTASVIARTTVPLIAIPYQATFAPIECIVYGTNFDANEYAAFEWLIKLARQLGAKVHCLHVASVVGSTTLHKMQNWKQRYTQYAEVSFFITSGDDPACSLREYVQEHDIQLLAVAHRQQNVLDQWMHYSHANDLALHSKTPVLIAQIQ